jgi:ABC-type uncharacterized transport system YnjBCD permease subunit
VIATGASELRGVFSSEELPGVIIAYMHGLKATFAVSIAFCALAFLTTLIIPWRRLPTHTTEAKKEAAPTAVAV